MPSDRPGEPWPEATYNGFAGAPAPARRRLPRMTGRNLAIGAALAVAAGLGFGMWARPNLGGSATDAAERTAPPVPIEVGKPPPETLQSDGKLEVLSPQDAAAARANANPAPPVASPPAEGYIPGPPPPLPEAARAPAYAPPPYGQRVPAQPIPQPAPMVRQAPPLPLEPQRLAQAPSRAGFDCSGARSPAEAMVCQDPELAAADREMSRAYRRALQSGAAPVGALRADQRDWLSIREDAARHSRRAVAQIYQQRIDELNAMAEGRGDDDGPGD
jgi:uncharacterized protein YecT (DUF1311 family)